VITSARIAGLAFGLVQRRPQVVVHLARETVQRLRAVQVAMATPPVRRTARSVRSWVMNFGCREFTIAALGQAMHDFP
jgi:hypothetical protein